MCRLFGLLKVLLIVGIDFAVAYEITKSIEISAALVAIILLYIWFGGYISLLKDGAVNSKKLPMYERNRLEAACSQLVYDVKETCGVKLSGIKLYLLPNDDTMNATAYGSRCISVTRGTLDNTDPVTLNAVLSHELSHIMNFDAEFQRAVFCSVTLLVLAIGVVSAVAMVVIFLIFLVLCCFRSWLGVLAFKGTTKVVGGFFSLLQRGVVMLYRTALSLVSRHSEYRCDKLACQLGYGIQLCHFLSLAEPYTQRQMTLTEALYRSHPPTAKRIARLEAYNSRGR